MKINPITKIVGGQDGVVFNDYLFRFDGKGNCAVYDVNNISDPITCFILDKSDVIVPHSNAVMFGNEYYCEEDEFPLLYSNIYNNYAKAENKLKGVCCVYRLQKKGTEFTTTLVQLIEIGFVQDECWKSQDGDDVRPYGNFTIDTENSIYYAFTMRDESNTTRYFSFVLPKLQEGEFDEVYQVKRVVLEKKDIIGQFDCEYHRYVQGACYNKGKIYSLEGFTDDVKNPPALRIIDTEKQCQLAYIPFSDFGLTVEPEMIDFANGICYYCDNHGNLYMIEF